MEASMDTQMDTSEDIIPDNTMKQLVFNPIKINVPTLPPSAFERDTQTNLLPQRRTIKREINGEVSESVIDTYLQASADRLAKMELMSDEEGIEYMNIEDEIEEGEIVDEQREYIPVSNNVNCDDDDDIQIVFENIIEKKNKKKTEEGRENKERKMEYFVEDGDDMERKNKKDRKLEEERDEKKRKKNKEKKLEEEREDKERKKKREEKKKLREKERIRRNIHTEKHRRERRHEDKRDSDRRGRSDSSDTDRRDRRRNDSRSSDSDSDSGSGSGRRDRSSEKHLNERRNDEKRDSDRRKREDIPKSYRSVSPVKDRNDKMSKSRDDKKYSLRGRRRSDSESSNTSIVKNGYDKRREGHTYRRRRYSSSSDVSIGHYGRRSDKTRDSDRRRRRRDSSTESSSIVKYGYRSSIFDKKRNSPIRRRRRRSSERSTSIVTSGQVSRGDINRAIRSTLTPQVSNLKLTESNIRSTLTPDVSNLKLIESIQTRAFQDPSNRDNYRTENMVLEEDEEENIEEVTNGSDMFIIDRDTSYSVYNGPDQAFSAPLIPLLARERFVNKNMDDFQFTFESMRRGQKELALKKVENTSLRVVVSPLGAAYDPVLEMFLYTDTGNGKIVLATYEGHVKDEVMGFKCPSAIAIIKPSSHFAVLDFNGITMVDMISNQKRIIADSFEGRFRGLATLGDGNLATILYCGSFFEPPSVIVFSTSAYNTRVCSCRISPVPFHGKTLPSFITAHKDMVYVTDLNRNFLSSFNYIDNGDQRLLKYVVVRNMSNYNESSNGLKTKYMAGICIDSSHSLLVADAVGRCIHHAASDGSLIQENIPFLDNSSPFISGIAVAPQGRLIVCYRHSHGVGLYDLVPRDTVEDGLVDKMFDLW